MKRRVVVTGMGVVSPIGNNLEEFSLSLRKGICGKRKMPDAEYAFPVKKITAQNGEAHSDKSIQFAMSAARQAMTDAGFVVTDSNSADVAIVTSSSKGAVASFPPKTNDEFLSLFPHFISDVISKEFKTTGYCKGYIAACATGTMNIAQGFEMVQHGMTECCLAGAADASLTSLMLAGYRSMKALAKEDIRPFDANRDGFLVGEGAGMVFLESYESAKKRGIKIYGEITSVQLGQDSKNAIIFDKQESALSKTIESLFKKNGVLPSEIDFVNLHGTGTKYGDFYEAEQIKKIFGARTKQIPMSSLKGSTGHMLGASGAVEIIASLIGMQNDFIFSNVGLREMDSKIDLNCSNVVRNKQNRKVLKISMGFGGQVVAMILKSCEK